MKRPAFACKITRKLTDLLESGAASKAEVRLLFLLAGEMDSHNIVKASINRLLLTSELDRKSAYRALAGLESLDWVRRHPTGYHINPSLMWRGGDRQWDMAVSAWEHRNE